jgi:hypothetical protein
MLLLLTVDKRSTLPTEWQIIAQEYKKTASLYICLFMNHFSSSDKLIESSFTTHKPEVKENPTDITHYEPC